MLSVIHRPGGKGGAQTAPQTVDSVLDEVLAHQGVALSGARHDAVEHVVEEVVRMVGRVGKGGETARVRRTESFAVDLRVCVWSERRG